MILSFFSVHKVWVSTVNRMMNIFPRKFWLILLLSILSHSAAIAKNVHVGLVSTSAQPVPQVSIEGVITD